MPEKNDKNETFEDDFGGISFEDEDSLNPETEQDLYNKQVVFNVYENIAKIKAGKKIDQKNALPEENEINKILKKIPANNDLLVGLREYPELIHKIQSVDNESSTSAKMDIFYSKIDQIYEALQNLSEKFGQDIIMHMLERNEIEKKAQEAFAELKEPSQRMFEYIKLKDEMFRESVLQIAKKQNLTEEDKKNIIPIKKNIDWVIEKELEDINNKKWEYIDDAIAEETKKNLLEIKQAKYQKLFNIKTLATLGLIMERREGAVLKLENEAMKLNDRAGEYHQIKF